jgi:hypothetical protein
MSGGCATRRCVTEWGWETLTVSLSQQADEAGGSLIRGMPGRAGSSPDNVGTRWHCQTARVRLARREGVREEPVSKPRKRGTGSNLADAGRGAARGRRPHHGGGQLRSRLPTTGGEATAKYCGVTVAMLPGHQLGASLVDRLHGERGNHPRPPWPRVSSPDGDRAGPSPADGRGMGRRPRSSPSWGKPGTWRRGPASYAVSDAGRPGGRW